MGMLNEFLKEAICGIKEKGGKQERMKNMEARNLPNGRTLTMTIIIIANSALMSTLTIHC